MKKRNLGLLLLLAITLFVSNRALAQSSPHPGNVTPETSTADAPKWYAMMTSHSSDTPRAYRFAGWDGTYLAGEKFADAGALPTADTQYLWRLEDAGNGNVKIVHYSGVEILAPEGATNNTVIGCGESGSEWALALYDESKLKYTLSLVGATTGHVYLNQMGTGHTPDYGFTVYEAGQAQSSGWYFYEATLGSTVDPTPATYTVSITAPEFGSLVVMNGEAAVADGDVLEANTVLTIVPTANEGYLLQRVVVNNTALSANEGVYTHTLVADATISATFVEEDETSEFLDYCYPSGTITRTDRFLNNITVSDGKNEYPVYGISKENGRSVYQNLAADNIMTFTAGSTLQFTVDWAGAWMHGYVYVDYDKDGAFSYELNSDGTPADGSELVSFTYYNGKNSRGESTDQNGKLLDIPSFVLPRTLAPGLYRIRFKVDWNYADPCGRDAGIGNSNADNAGDIIDFTLRVEEPAPLPDFYTVTLPEQVANGTLAVTYTDAENAVQTLANGENTVPRGSVLTINATPAEGYRLTLLTVNGMNFTNGSNREVDEALNISVFFAGENDYVSDNPFETMIRLGRMTLHSPVYQMPAGSVNGGYIATATTSGDAVVYPLGYARASNPSSYFMVISKETALLSSGANFELNATVSTDLTGKTVTAYTDWNRDGVFEKVADAAQVNGKVLTQSIAIPADASLGKNRIRVRIDGSAPSSADATVSGRVYDFVFYIVEAGSSERTDCFISVTSSNDELGSAMIETAANAQGRYDIGTEVTVKAIINPEAGSEVEFKGWQENGVVVSEELTYTFVVETSTGLVALFEAPEPVLSTPQVSTAEDPIWYQIMNAHTAEARKERYIAYDTNLDSDYTTAVRVEKPATTADKFLWRLEDAGNGQVYLVNKGSDLKLSGSKVLESVNFSAGEEGSAFTIEPSGHENGSFSIKFEGDAGYLLNAKDGLWSVVLYNAGVGTGSGWYFYEVQTVTGIEAAGIAPLKAVLHNGHLTVDGLSGRNTIKAVSLSGQLLGTYVTKGSVFEGDLKYAERFILLVVEPEQGEPTILKLVDNRF